MDVILPIFSQRLKQLRRDRKITQKAMLIFLAGYFQTSVDYLLGLSDQR